MTKQAMIGAGNTVFCSISIAVLLSTTAYSSDWPCWRGPNRDGITAERITVWPPQKLWSGKISEGCSQVVVSEHRVYTVGWDPSTGNDTVYCFSDAPGVTNPLPLWTRSYYGDWPRSVPAIRQPEAMSYGTKATPTVDGNELYTISVGGVLNCFNKTNGALLWSATNTPPAAYCPDFGVCGSPLVEGNLVIVNEWGHGLAYDKRTGNLLWGTNDLQKCGLASPYAVTLGTKRAVVVLADWYDPANWECNDDNRICVVDPANGNILWWAASSESTTGGAIPEPIIYNGKIIYTCGSNHGHGGTFAFNLASDGSQPTGRLDLAWHTGSFVNSLFTPVLLNGCIYGIDGNGDNGHAPSYPAPYGVLRCGDPTDGGIKWSTTEAYGSYGTVIVAGGELVVLSGDGWLSVLDVTSTGYTVVHSNAQVNTDYDHTEPLAMFTIANGLMYVRGTYNTLSAYRVGCIQPEITIAPRTNQADMIELSWASEPGTTYDVYKSTNLLTGWPAQPCASFIGDGSMKSFSEPMAAQICAYYRIKAR